MKNPFIFAYSILLWAYIFLFFILVPLFAIPFSLIFGRKRAFRWFFKLFGKLFLLIFRNRVEVAGRGNIPKGRNVVLLSNHISFLDPFLLNAVLPGFYNFVVFARVLFNPLAMIAIRGAKLIVRPSGHFLVGSKVLLNIVDVINKGESFILFPSEHIIYDGSIGGVRQALYGIIEKTDAVILPVYLKGVMRLGFYQKPFRAKVIIGRPISKRDILFGRDEFIRRSIASLAM